MSDLENKKNPVVITIARDFGAEGHEIGRMLADELGIPLYDNELLVRASLRTGESLDKMAAYDERLAVENMAFLPDRYDARSYSDKLFQKMSQVILDLGETESCIIEGRLSDYLLRNNPNHIAVLVTAPFEDRVEIVRKKRGLNKKKGAKLVKQLSEEYEGNFLFEYSPESFTGTEVDYAVEVCNAVLDIMQPTPERPMIINLPVTVEMSMPHVYANQIEYCDKHLKYRDSVIISTHPHNDRGTGVACAELAVLAGAQRVECCLFGNGERTGNVDAVTLAMNMYSHGVDPKLDFSDMPTICATYERVTRMHIYERTPYAGQLVFAAFSGSHQDAIAKGMAYRKEHGEHRWTCPYIPVDPHDIGRTYDADVIRINSQSGKGGIGFVLEQNYGYNLPPKMREVLGYKVKSVSDHSHKELSAAEVLHIFEDTYLNRAKPLNVVEAHFAQVNGITATVTLELNGQRKVVTSVGNGRLDAVANAIQSATGMDFHLENYSEHSLDEGSTSRAASYVGLVWGDNTVTWGAGTDTDIIVAGVRALVSAINNK